MLLLLDLIHLGVVLASNIMLIHPQEFDFPTQRDAVVEVKLHREGWRSDGKGKCHYTGVMVPFVRDWELSVPHGDGENRILPPEPDKTAGHAFLVTRKFCKDKEPETILRAGQVNRVKPIGQGAKGFPAHDMLVEKPEQYPQWLGQVVARIERVAQHDPKAQAFLDSGVEQFNIVLPERLKAHQSIPIDDSVLQIAPPLSEPIKPLDQISSKSITTLPV
jgi:hypothetical protein